jgi:hypothetical protein
MRYSLLATVALVLLFPSASVADPVAITSGRTAALFKRFRNLALRLQRFAVGATNWSRRKTRIMLMLRRDWSWS